MKVSNSTQTDKKDVECAIANNIQKMQTERHRLLCRLNRARSIVKRIRHDYEAMLLSHDDTDRLLDQYEAFISDVEVYVEHYEYEISKVKNGLKEAVSLPNSKAKRSFLTYIIDDSTRTIANLRIANTEYKEILSILPAEGLD